MNHESGSKRIDIIAWLFVLAFGIVFLPMASADEGARTHEGKSGAAAAEKPGNATQGAFTLTTATTGAERQTSTRLVTDDKVDIGQDRATTGILDGLRKQILMIPLLKERFRAVYSAVKDDGNAQKALTLLREMRPAIDGFIIRAQGSAVEDQMAEIQNALVKLEKALEQSQIDEARAILDKIGQAGSEIEKQLRETTASKVPAENVATASTPNDALLDPLQKRYLAWTEERFRKLLEDEPRASTSDLWGREEAWLEMIRTGEHAQAVNGLAIIRSKAAVPSLRRIATEQVEKDNRVRWMAVRALGFTGDKIVVPDLIHLLYHYNQNTRIWAQISLVRLTGQNFGRDWEKWGDWWTSQNVKPPFSPAKIEWAKSPMMLEYADPGKQKEADEAFLQGTPTGRVPGIISMSPHPGSTEVDPNTTAITVTFDTDMREDPSLTGSGQESPANAGSDFWFNARTWVKPVKLEAGKYYRLDLNAPGHIKFHSKQGVPAKPAAFFFTTTGASEELRAKVRAPRPVKFEPENFATGVNPLTKELRVTFDMPMSAGYSWTGGGDQYPEIVEGQKPYWTPDKKTCVVQVRLKPDWEYVIGINSVSHKNFRSEAGVPAEPMVYGFKTAAK